MAALWKFKRCCWTAKTLFGLGHTDRAFTAFMVARWITFTVPMVFQRLRNPVLSGIVKAICGPPRPRVLIVSATCESLRFQPARD